MSTEDTSASPEPAPDPAPASETAEPADKTAKDDAFPATQKMFDPDRHAKAEAYIRGSRNLSFGGPAAVIDKAEVGNLYVGDQYNIRIGQAVALTIGPVRDEVLKWVRQRYVQVANYDDMLAKLREQRVVLMHGLPGTGRATTALHLLDDVSHGAVCRMDVSDTDMKSLVEKDFTEGHGYYVELSGRAAERLTETLMDQLRTMVGKAKAYCVLICPKDERHRNRLGDYAFSHEPPGSRAILDRHIEWEILVEDSDDINDRVATVVADPDFLDAWGPRPRPAETVLMAKLALRVARSEITVAAVVEEGRNAVRLQVSEWFDELRQAQKDDELIDASALCAFRIALAVFNEAPYHTVAEAADLLVKHFNESRPMPTGSSMTGAATRSWRSARRQLFADDQESRLAAARAHIIAGEAVFGEVRVDVGLVTYEDARFPVTMLRHVWQNHHTLRQPLIDWLLALSTDARPWISVRAGQAAGLLCALDFHYGYGRLILPGSQADISDNESARLFAALALDQAAQQGMRRVVEERIHRWRLYGSTAEQWTAAAALGYEFGRQSIDKTLEHLRVLGTPSERRDPPPADEIADLQWITSLSLAKLFAFGQVAAVLDRLTEWMGHGRRSIRELAAWTVLQLVSFRGYELTYLEMSGGNAGQHVIKPERSRWPLLLAMQAEDPRLVKPFANLLRRVLDGHQGPVLQLLLRIWFKTAERDPACLTALILFLPDLVESRRDLGRLRHLVAVMRNDWVNPLTAGVADRIDAAFHQLQSWENVP